MWKGFAAMPRWPAPVSPAFNCTLAPWVAGVGCTRGPRASVKGLSFSWMGVEADVEAVRGDATACAACTAPSTFGRTARRHVIGNVLR